MVFHTLHAFNMTIRKGTWNILLLSSANFFFQIYFTKDSFSNLIRVSNRLNSDQDQHSVVPDTGPKLFAKIVSR